MTPAQYARHQEWMQSSVRVTLAHLRNLWAVRDSFVVTDDIRSELIDLRERLQWLIERPSAGTAPTCTDRQRDCLGTDGPAQPTPSSNGRITSRVA